jgi:D-alanyl-D-alanine carboxypeptidase/D-alanyl-D-alanine-endopeptidase (penicillin-binding protein 4)
VSEPFNPFPGDPPQDGANEPVDAAPTSRRAARAGGGGAGGGIGAVFTQHPRAWIIAGSTLVFLLLATGSLFAGVAYGTTPAAAPIVAPTTSATPTARATPNPQTTATALRTCSIARQAAAPALGTFSGTVINTATGEVLWDRAGSTGVATASVMKTLTSATALNVLGPNYRFTTTVYQGSTPGSVVLVGGGDPTLSALPAGQESVYKGAPKLSDLAAQVNKAWDAANPDQPITSVVLDASMWNTSDAWDPTWPLTERTQGYQPLITALMVDGDRANPRAQNSPRSTDPIGAAGAAFVAALGLPGSTPVSQGTVIAGSTQLGQVQSQPISTLIGQMLPVSDNTLAEMMDRVSSKVSGADGSAASLTGVVKNALATYGLDATGIVIKDGSGESYADAVPPTLAAKLMTMVGARAKDLGYVLDALPVAGKSGTLASRFTGANAIARGAVQAKTGSIAVAYALAGIIHAADGSTLSFAFFAEGKLSATGAMNGLDTVTTAAFSCGNNLSNN